MDDLRRGIKHLRELSETDLVRAIETGLVNWEAKHLERCALELSEQTGMAPSMVTFGLKRVVAAHRRPQLKRWLEEAQTASGRSLPRISRVLMHILPGNIPGLAIPASIEGLLARCPVFLKAAEGDKAVPRSWIETLRETHPVFENAVDWDYWKGGEDVREPERLREADIVIASGTRSTLDALEQRVSVPLIQHGPKFSLAMVGSGWREAAGSWWRDVARECILWEQKGCLSPWFFFVEGDIECFALELAAAFSYWDKAWPPPPETVERTIAVRNFRTHFELLTPSSGNWVGNRFTMGWSRQVVPLFPSGRCLGIHPMGAVNEVFDRYREQVQAIGVAFDPKPPAPVVFPLTQIQNPPAGWRADGRSILAELFA